MYEIEVDGLDELNAKFSQAPEIVGKELEQATKEAGAEILRTEVQEAPHDTGKLQQSIKMQYEPIQIKVWPDVNYALYVHEGTKPHFPPVDALEGWARRHGMNAYLVARAISRKGTQANKFVARTVAGVSGTINKIFAKALQNITGKL